jgi:hypothetical protein
MKTQGSQRVTTVVLAMICLLATGSSYAVAPDGRTNQDPARDLDLVTWFDANTLLMFVNNVGSFAHDDGAYLYRLDGLYFPRPLDLADILGARTAIYAAGLWVGAEVDGEVRVAIAEYSQEYVPGTMLGGMPQPDNSSFRVYKINEGDTPGTNDDYRDWPFDDGAPATVDELGNRVPLILGKQALWTVFNDADPLAHWNDAGGTSPLGIEVQLYAHGTDISCELSQAVFMHYKIINKGSVTLENTYISLWVDPDLGAASDDLVGCDTLLSLGYCYNDGPDAVYGANPPAVGIKLLQGPIVPSPGDSAWVHSKNEWIPDHRNLPMTAFAKYINGTDPDTYWESYNYMRGLEPDGSPIVNPVTGTVTPYMVSGDPVSGSGWIDESSADRRFMLSCGPLTMAPSDTQEVVVAVLIGAGEAELSPFYAAVCEPAIQTSAISEIKRVASVIQDEFMGFGAPPVATDDSYGARGDATLYVIAPGVLANDSDSGGSPLSAILESDVSHGSLELNADGSFLYSPNDPSFSGEDQFTYYANDGTANSNTTATVHLFVRPGAPIAPGDFDEDGFITSTDLSAEIDALFRNGPDPTDGGCTLASRGDFDCDGFNTAHDLTTLIDYIFAGGEGPCDPCDLQSSLQGTTSE